jgi:pimeloyl-ACP methyl ester carboxylesterase
MNINQHTQEPHNIFSYVSLPSPNKLSSDKKNIVFVHGFPGRPQDFRWLIPHLQMHNLYFVALPGQGLTPPNDTTPSTIESNSLFVERCISTFEIDTFYIVGHSMGGPIASCVASHHQSCLGLILLSSVGVRPHKGFRYSYPKVAYYLTKKPFDIIFERLIKKAFVQMGFPSGIDKITIHTVLEHAFHFSFETHLQSLRSVVNANRPIMIIYTKNDPLIEASIFEEICSITSPSLTCIYDDGGHNPQRKYCEDIGQKIDQFVTQRDNRMNL